MEISSTFNNDLENITTKQCAFFVRMADLDIIFSTHTNTHVLAKNHKFPKVTIVHKSKVSVQIASDSNTTKKISIQEKKLLSKD